MKLTIGFSPCPNDTFIFDALVNGSVKIPGISLEPVLEDVETLNQWALEGKLDITKLSFPAYFQSIDTYELLHSGSALGKGVGPLLVTNVPANYSEKVVNNLTVVLPGIHTTAHLLFSFAYPQAKKKHFKVFHEIEDAVSKGEFDTGVLIHENRFTYQERGLHLVKDLGTHWENELHVPIPLGGIAIKRSLGKEVWNKVNDGIHQSVVNAFRNLPEISEYVHCHAQAMSADVMRKHIDLYVNDYSLNLGEEGLRAIATLKKVYENMHCA